MITVLGQDLCSIWPMIGARLLKIKRLWCDRYGNLPCVHSSMECGERGGGGGLTDHWQVSVPNRGRVCFFKASPPIRAYSIVICIVIKWSKLNFTSSDTLRDKGPIIDIQHQQNPNTLIPNTPYSLIPQGSMMAISISSHPSMLHQLLLGCWMRLHRIVSHPYM